MTIWWDELSAVDQARVHDFARGLRDAQRETREQNAGQGVRFIEDGGPNNIDVLRTAA